jgi:lipopolysaccharide/colanic/teichoic acid biosynthesis glycosyltransferase
MDALASKETTTAHRSQRGAGVRAAELDAQGARETAALGKVKRITDIAVAALVLLLTLPIFLVIAFAIVIESRGPVFYRADRVGRGGARMRMFKFRKMLPDAGGLPLTTGRDPRLTRVGAFLTRSKLDELPQFLNVLRGEMSLVGPRPEDPAFVMRRADDYEEILTVRPGITGLSQIAFADESRILSTDDPLEHYLQRIFPQKIAIDRHYARRATLAMDLRILCWTTVAVVMRRPVAVHRDTGAMRLRRRPAPHPAHAPVTPAWLELRPALSSSESGGVSQTAQVSQHAG